MKFTILFLFKVKDEMNKAIKFLEDVLRIERDFYLPCDTIELSPLCSDSSPIIVKLPFTLHPIPYKDIHAQVYTRLHGIILL